MRTRGRLRPSRPRGPRATEAPSAPPSLPDPDATRTMSLARIAPRLNAADRDSVAPSPDVGQLMLDVGRRARAAARAVGLAAPEAKEAALRAMARRIRGARDTILAANAEDM